MPTAKAPAAQQQDERWQAAPTVVGPPLRLPANERRRAGTVVKVSMAVADQACAMAGLDPAGLATVFTASTGDPDNCHAMCEALAMPERVISPTRFMNSVHNASAGYWHIAVQSRAASTSLAAFDGGVAAGLREAASQCAITQAPVLLVTSDLPYPPPLAALRRVADVFAFALLLLPKPSAAHARLVLSLSESEPATPCADARLEALRLSNPSARALPLLAALAGSAPAQVAIEGQDGMGLRIAVTPCP